MQTCSKCYTQVSDTEQICPNCKADLIEFSVSAVALKRFKDNPRVLAVRVSAPADACPVCQGVKGTYPKDQVPRLPTMGCSHPAGCLCFYEPVLDEIYP